MKITDAIKMMEEAQVKSFLPKEEERLDSKKTSVCISGESSKVEYIDAVLIEQRGYDGYSAMSEYDILQESVNVNVELDQINFDYKNGSCCSYKGHTIYNVKAIKVAISPFGKDLIAKGIISEHELMEYGTKEAKKQIEDIEVKRERDIDECVAILAKYGIEVQL